MTAKKKGQGFRPVSAKRADSWVTITTRDQWEKLAPYIRAVRSESGAKHVRAQLYSPRDRARIRVLQRQLRPWLESRGWLNRSR